MEDSVFRHDASLYSFFINVKNCLSVAKIDERKLVGEKIITNIHTMIESFEYFSQEIPNVIEREYTISYMVYHLGLLIQYIDDKINYRDLERQQSKYSEYRRLFFKLKKRYLESSMGKASDDYMCMLRLKFSYSLLEEQSPFPDIQSKILLMRKDIEEL